MSRTSNPSAVKPAGCVLDWNRREGFLRGTRILDERRWWYAIGYTDNGESDGNLVFASANPKLHIPTLSRMPVAAGGELIEMDRVIRNALGFDPEEETSDSNLAANIGGAAAGVTLKGHLHIVTVGAVDGVPHSGMGLMLLRRMYDRWYTFADDMVADLAALSDRDEPAEVIAARIQHWKGELELLKGAKLKADAYKRQ